MQPLSQHRLRRGGAHGGMPRTVLRGKSSANAMASQRPERPSRAAHLLSPITARPASTLAALARTKRGQLEALAAAGVTVSLQLEVEGRTRLASLRPAQESISGPVERRGARRVFTLHPPRSLIVLVERS